MALDDFDEVGEVGDLGVGEPPQGVGAVGGAFLEQAVRHVLECRAEVAAGVAQSEAAGIPVRYEQLTDDEAAAFGPEIADTKKLWEDGNRWHADIETLRVIHSGLRTLTDWLAESGAAAIRANLTRP